MSVRHCTCNNVEKNQIHCFQVCIQTKGVRCSNDLFCAYFCYQAIIFLFLVLGPVHRFKKLCEKLQVLLLSNKRQGSIDSNRLSQTMDEHMLGDEKDCDSPSTRLELAHLSDTESESEALDSPMVAKRSLFKRGGNQEGAVEENRSWAFQILVILQIVSFFRNDSFILVQAIMTHVMYIDQLISVG